jgi:hypothetical protein
MNTPVSFPLAKLLKEKGFEGNYFHYWNRVNYSGEWEVDTRIWDTSVDYIEAPTIADVVMWLYEKNGIWISVDVINNLFKYKILQIEGTVSKTFGNEIRCSSFDYNSPKEAYEAAIEYTLNNLI